MDAKERIAEMVRASAGDRIGGMSVLSAFIAARERDADALMVALAELIETEDGGYLSTLAWLASGLVSNGVRDARVETGIRRRLAEYESKADRLDDDGRAALEMLRSADANVASAD